MAGSGRNAVVGRFIVVALAFPAVATAVTVVLLLAWRSDLPDPLAIHWGGSGGPDGFGSLATILGVELALGLGVPGLIVATTLPLLRNGARGPNFRFMGSLAAGIAVLAAVLNTMSVAMQRGLADAHDGPSVLPALGAGFAAAAAAGTAAWFIQPPQQAVIEGISPGTTLDLRDGERAVWMRTATTGPALSALLTTVVIALAGGSLVSWQVGATAAAWILLGASAFVFLAFAATTTFHVRVDHTGVSAVSALGVPRLHVALADIAEAGVANVNGFAEFGGYGLRLVPGATGVILRNGESLQITRHNQTRLVMTVDDASTAAGLLNAFVKRASAEPPVSP